VAFYSILFEERDDRASRAQQEAPEYFRDLNLDQIVDAITAGKDDYDLKPFFHEPLKTTGAILYRHEVFRDLEDVQVLGCIKSFADAMHQMRQKLAQANKLHYKHQKQRWFLHAAELYCAAVRALKADLPRLELSSRGLLAFREYVAHYVASDHFSTLAQAATALASDLAAIRYAILIKGNGFEVRKYESERDYSEQVAAKDYRVDFAERADMNHIEEKILDFVALLYPEIFAAVDRFCLRNQVFADAPLMNFDREIQFYIAYVDHMGILTRAGLAFCYPTMSATDKEIHDDDGYDLALAAKLASSKTPTVCNDFHLMGAERILVVSGPNQGGKTTFARSFGQLHHLGSIGCPVPGREARLFLFDSMFTHFEREEDIKNLHGKLQDDLVRIHHILENATPRSIIIMNEIFTSTALQDAVFLARKVIEEIMRLDLLCVCITFLDELASLSEKTVSMVSTVAPDNPTVRTFKVVRRPADGRSYAISIAEKYRLTYESLQTRLPSRP